MDYLGNGIGRQEEETPYCPNCGLNFQTWHEAKQHVKHCKNKRRKSMGNVSNKEKQGWSGRTDEVMLPQLSADFWKNGVSIDGKLEGWREARYVDRTAIFYKLELSEEIEVNGQKTTTVELTPLTGMLAAFKSLKDKGYSPQIGDLWMITCTGIKRSKKHDMSDSPEFEIHVTR